MAYPKWRQNPRTPWGTEALRQSDCPTILFSFQAWFERNERTYLAGCGMARSAIARWSGPEVIVVATNLLEGQRLTLHAIHQAKLSNARVLLVYVAPPAYLRNGSSDEMPLAEASPLSENIQSKLDGMAGEFQQEGVGCELLVLNGLAEEQIPRLVKSRSVDRVIVATRNATGVSRLLESSVAEQLIAGLEVPVCVIGRRAHSGAAGGAPPGRILLAASFQSGSALAARFASTLAELHHSQLVLLHVLDSAGMGDQERELAKYTAHRRLADLVPKEARHRHQPVCLIREGDPAEIIACEAGSTPQDLLILGAPNPSMHSRLLGTSVVHRVVAESRCPVITIKPSSATDYQPDFVDPEVALAHSRVEVEAIATSR
jgi:nucleotide-binding universal stress UspA family protein